MVSQRKPRWIVRTFPRGSNASLPGIFALHRMFPTTTLTLEYFEQGQTFCGGVTFDSFDSEDMPCEPGTPRDEWRCDEYRGRRGG